MRIKIIQPKALKEEEEEIVQVVQDVVPEVPEITYESNPLEFILQKYPTLTETLVKLLTEEFRDYIVGVYVMAPKPTIFKIVLHNNRIFYLTYLGRSYEAKVSGKKYYLLRISELERATVAISELLILGAPPKAEGPTEELPSGTNEKPPVEVEKSEETTVETPPEETPEEELKESVKKYRLVEETSSTKKDLKKLGYKDEDIIDVTKTQIKLLVPGKTRLDVINTLVNKLGYKWDKDYKGSSIGAVIAKDGTIIIPKPKEKQGGGSAGLGNEAFIANKINQTVEEVNSSITVVIKSKNKTIKYNNVTGAEEVGRDTSGGKKSDIRLLSGDKTVGNLSLKQENAGMWESADKRYKDLMIKLVNKLKTKPYPNLGLKPSEKKDIYRLYNPKTKEEYSGVIITGLDKSDMNAICFGTDDPKTVIVKETFDDSDFDLKGKVLTITVHGLLTDLKDIDGTSYEPILVIRHDSTRTATLGLRPIVYTKEKVYKDDKITGNRIELPFSKIK